MADDKRVILVVGGAFPLVALARLLNHPDAEVVDLIQPKETSPTFEGLDKPE